MGKKNKSIGNSFEYRIRDWFKKRDGWQSERNPLSGASEQFTNAVGKHDVRAWKDSIFLQIEAKKRSRTKDPKKRHQIEIMKEWIDKIDFDKDEILVIGFDRSDLYTLIPTKRLEKILGREIALKEDISTYSGGTQFVIKLKDLEENEYSHVYWKPFDIHYSLLSLDKFITLRETINLEDEITIEDKIKRCTSIDQIKNLEKEELENLSYGQKKLLYQKFETLENGLQINPFARATDQFWLDDAFLLVCPHCNEKITKKHLKKEEEQDID